ncbi:Transcriptional regulator of acetoin/glycerol metabolism [Evansella caseinilytica]|uniref:Transcriptional regulator of acetoin/glycerol metabolism n=1 Tax=Evansella caseinilytica TaxID=1503961 RepID=A0A1H3HTY3_9BACI|nr:sigma-54-dependent Fis family transcriptional regulator [Evansella caseinilytica]SDY18880.1 Transcriptional regulator of acetoin/glycerol metabolism [Evansella caseinilytica]
MASVIDVDSNPPYIATSWKRCHDHGLIPGKPADDQIVSGNKLKEIQQNSHSLLQHAIPQFLRLLPVLKRNQQIILLVNADGQIIHHEGDPVFATRAQSVQLQTGANWHENKKGTNAIGLSLIEEEPVIVEGDQHFFTENHFISCASSPIFSSAGELIGAVNISGHRNQDYMSALMMACLIAERIQTQLLLTEAKNENALIIQELEYTANLVTAPVLTLDSDKHIVRANHSARKILGKDCIGKTLKENSGFRIKTLEDNTSKVWRAVAVNQSEKKQGKRNYQFTDIFAACPVMKNAKNLARKAALTDFPILITGESGTGKELFAQSIHQESMRKNQPFIAVNCSAIPDSLVESELFGYERGAFTGANAEGKTGKFEAADQGTIFLDEIGDMSLRAQATLLRVIQEQAVTRVGSVKSKPINVRILAATHRNLLEEVKAGRFRADLYYRLRGIQILLPPLRERSDIGDLALHLLEQLTRGNGGGGLTSGAKKLLTTYPWPGNIRELNSILMNALFLADGLPIDVCHLYLDEQVGEADGRLMPEKAEEVKKGTAFHSLATAEKQTILQTLRLSDGNISKAAKMLNIGRNTLYRKINRYNISF